jgi:hypothetical protein
MLKESGFNIIRSEIVEDPTDPQSSHLTWVESVVRPLSEA